VKDTVRHRTSKYLNNRIEADHGALKRLIRPTRGFQSMKTAYATIKGFEIMRLIRRRHCMLIKPGITGEVPDGRPSSPCRLPSPASMA
jgi:transposase, IS6 family